MRRLVLAALLATLVTASLAVALPAWAANVAATAAELRQEAYNVCRDVGVSMNICTMKHADSEAEAVAWAKQMLELCKSDDPKDYMGGLAATCLKDRAYVKQRWGY